MVFKIVLAYFVCLTIASAQVSCMVEPYKITVISPDGTPISNVKVSLLDQNNQVEITYTDRNGQIDAGQNGCVRASFEYTTTDPIFDKLTTLDLILIQRHILNLTPFQNNALFIAADANFDGKITASDLTDFRKIILQINQTLPSNKSFHFAIKESIITSPTHFNETNVLLLPFIKNDEVVVYYISMGNVN